MLQQILVEIVIKPIQIIQPQIQSFLILVIVQLPQQIIVKERNLHVKPIAIGLVRSLIINGNVVRFLVWAEMMSHQKVQ